MIIIGVVAKGVDLEISHTSVANTRLEWTIFLLAIVQSMRNYCKYMVYWFENTC
jgi:hypothetical protein